MTTSAVLALLSFPAFWLNGYGTTHVGSADLPLGSMAAGLNGLLCTQLRLFFLHNLLLGWVSSALLGTIFTLYQRNRLRQPDWLIWLWAGGVGTLVLMLLGVGLIEFLPISAGLLLRIAAWSSLGVASVPMLILRKQLVARVG